MTQQLDTIISDAELYDIFNANCVEDIDWYKTVLSGSTNVLELGIGTGRVAIPLSKMGIKVFGVDNSADMLSRLEKKIKKENITNINFQNQDFRHLSLNSTYDYILFPFCTFNFLRTIEDQTKCLISIKNNMHKDTKIIFDLLTLNTFFDSFNNDKISYFDTIKNEDDSIMEIYISSRFDQTNQLFSQERIFRKFSTNKLEAEYHTVMKNRFFFLGEFKLLLEKCGYVIQETIGSYTHSPYTQNSKCLIVIASKK